MDIAALRSKLEEINAIPDQVWLSSLSERKRVELEFHDRDRARDKIKAMDQDTYERFYGNKKYYQATEQSKRYVDDWIARHAPGKVFLDYACGNGDGAIKAAKAGAGLAIGIDISSVSVGNAKSDAEQAGVSRNSYFVQADAENTKLPDSSVDFILCRGMLHHLDLSHCFPELRRILAPGGKILAVEALDYNPLIKLYRHLTPDMRTEWEKAHILSHKDLRFAERFFDLGEVRYWHITSILGPHLRPFMPLLHGIDALLTRLPLVKLLSWIFTFELKSNKSG
ncbi:MAG TPA: class I SAM-dependent methyltransferase [Steroidobacteraceae bacterium]|nr:class I SAM-dependent methyltransferase [Steroidobacteraceae bacterium]